MSQKIDKIFWVHESRVQASSRLESQASRRLESNRPEPKRAGVQRPSVQNPSVQSPCNQIMRPEFSFSGIPNNTLNSKQKLKQLGL